MAFSVPLFCILLALYFFGVRRDTFRDSFVKAMLITFFFVAVLTEVLSVFSLVNFFWISRIWISLDISLFALLYFKLDGDILITQIRKEINKLRSLVHFDLAVMGGIVMFLGFSFVIALLSPPNNYDSMTYHMARVSHWLQNENVCFYPTWIERQNHAMPLAEFAILHLQILSKSDAWANLVQWFSYLGSIVISSSIAKEFNFSKKHQLLSGILVATLPIAILESSSTQNDLVVGFFCLTFTYFLIKLGKEVFVPNMLFSALALGLALMTKGTGYIYCAGIGLTLGLAQLFSFNKREGRRKYLGYLVLIVTLALIINIGIYSRNIDLYNHPLSTANKDITTDSISIPITISNLIRNAALHLSTPFPWLNQIITQGTSFLLGPLTNDPKATFLSYRFDVRFGINEDMAGNFFHFLLISVCTIVLVIKFRKLESLLQQYTLVVIICSVFFSVLIKWQPWGTRLQIPNFYLGIILVVAVISRVKISEFQYRLIVVGLIIFGLPYILFNTNRPIFPIMENNPLDRLLFINDKDKKSKIYQKVSYVLSPIYVGDSLLVSSRRSLYFMSYKEISWSYEKAAERIIEYGSEEVGLYLDGNVKWEYPLWVLTDQHAKRGELEFKHVGMNNITRTLIDEHEPWPQYIFATSSEASDVLVKLGYRLIEDAKHMGIYRRED